MIQPVTPLTHPLAFHEDFKAGGKVSFFYPGNFSREIQQGKVTKSWHIPALDSNLWVCLDLEKLKLPR
jgi:hypothetical protein